MPNSSLSKTLNDEDAQGVVAQGASGDVRDGDCVDPSVHDVSAIHRKLIPHPAVTKKGALARLKRTSPYLRGHMDRITRMAQLPETILIRGESGVGKELLARAIHESSPRGGGPFVVVNCSVTPPEFLEDTLFGHRHPGLFDEAHHGTLFLDEIGRLPPLIQHRLQQLLHSRQHHIPQQESLPGGDVRIISASCLNLEEMLTLGALRRDLYFLLSELEFHLPALRDRRMDIPALAQWFVEHYSQLYGRSFSSIHDDVLALFASKSWMLGNVRELEWTIRQAVALGEDAEVLTLASLNSRPTSSELPPARDIEDSISLGGLLEMDYGSARMEMRRRFAAWYVRRCLEDAENNHSGAARRAGMKRPNFIRLMREVGITSGR